MPKESFHPEFRLNEFLVSEVEEQAFYEHDSNRAVAVVWSSIVENRLTDALRTALRNDKRTIEALLRPDAPLGAFGTKIRIGYLLGLYESDVRDDLIQLSKIRNEAAHGVAKVDFESSPFKDRMDTMRTLQVHRRLLEDLQKKVASGVQERSDETVLFILGNELTDYRNSFHLIIRFLIHKLVDIEHYLIEYPIFRTIAIGDIESVKRIREIENSERPVDTATPEFVYREALAEFNSAVEEAIAVSRTYAGKEAKQQRLWCSVLFAKLCTTGYTILSLCPRSRVNKFGRHWDFGSLAAVVRTFLKCSAALFYLGVETVSDQEWLARRNSMLLSDCQSRIDLFTALDSPEQRARFGEQKAELQASLNANEFFRALPEELKKMVLGGQQWSFSDEAVILRKIGEFESAASGYLEFSFSHADVEPVSFARMALDESGVGVECNAEISRFIPVLEMCTSVMKRITTEVQRVFEAETPQGYEGC